jgi:hypothetical protein
MMDVCFRPGAGIQASEHLSPLSEPVTAVISKGDGLSSRRAQDAWHALKTKNESAPSAQGD